MEETNVLDKKDKEEMKELEDELMNDDFFKEYKKKRMEEIENEDNRRKYGFVMEIDKKTYVEEVRNASQHVNVILHLYQEAFKVCKLLNRHLDTLASKYPYSKFVKSISTKCIPNFPDKKVPTLLLYKNGKL